MVWACQPKLGPTFQIIQAQLPCNRPIPSDLIRTGPTAVWKKPNDLSSFKHKSISHVARFPLTLRFRKAQIIVSGFLTTKLLGGTNDKPTIKISYRHIIIKQLIQIHIGATWDLPRLVGNSPPQRTRTPSIINK